MIHKITVVKIQATLLPNPKQHACHPNDLSDDANKPESAVRLDAKVWRKLGWAGPLGCRRQGEEQVA
jgi:hypothetical protein